MPGAGLRRLWRSWKRSGATVDGRQFQTRVSPSRRRMGAADGRLKASQAWKLRPGLQFLDHQYDEQAVLWRGPDIGRYERIIAATASVTATAAAELLKCRRNYVLFLVISGRLLALRYRRSLLLPLRQFDRRNARVRPEYTGMFKEAVAARANAWDLAEQLSQPVAIDDAGRTLHQIVMAREQELVRSVVEELAQRRVQAACSSRPQ